MESVDEFLAASVHPQKDVVQAVRATLLASDPRVREGIKWNAPSFAVDDWFASFTLRPGAPVRLVLHTGAKAVPGHPDVVVDDPDGLLVWRGTDRAIVTFTDLADARAKSDALTHIVRAWIPQLPGARGAL